MSSVKKTPSKTLGKGGSAHALPAAAAATQAATLAEYQASPDSFMVFTVTENIGVPKKGVTDYLLKGRPLAGGREMDMLVRTSLLRKSNKLAIRGMGDLGAHVLVKAHMVSRMRPVMRASAIAGQIEMMMMTTEQDLVVYGMLPK